MFALPTNSGNSATFSLKKLHFKTTVNVIKCLGNTKNQRLAIFSPFFQCCAMEVNCESMAVICATLANGGTCPTTLDPIIKPEAVRDVLSLLHSCGFYEYSGQFAFKVRI